MSRNRMEPAERGVSRVDTDITDNASTSTYAQVWPSEFLIRGDVMQSE